ncbi:MAG: hypothetical protein JWR21_4361 [Herminiimonas sp.]|nr:hypothetical protein [Herminiimonas sp.]
MKNAFFSFHFSEDSVRAAKVRNMGVVEGNEPVSDNDWEEVKGGGDAAIKRWIEGQLAGRSTVIVLVGTKTAHRPWVQYEIETAWNAGKSVFGIRIHNITNFQGLTSKAGPNPFDTPKFKDGSPLSSKVKLHDPAGRDSKEVYATIKANIATWCANAAHK